MNNHLIVLALKIFFADFEKQDVTLLLKLYFYQIFNICSLPLGVAIAQIWSLCSDWLCIFL